VEIIDCVEITWPSDAAVHTPPGSLISTLPKILITVISEAPTARAAEVNNNISRILFITILLVKLLEAPGKIKTQPVQNGEKTFNLRIQHNGVPGIQNTGFQIPSEIGFGPPEKTYKPFLSHEMPFR
jgi:hypothetical protein